MTENTHHVVGPPGTGKTTYLARQASNAVSKYGPGGVLLCSLTKAAAAEIGSRDTLVSENMIGTLHAHAFRALGQPVLAETKLAQWNEDHPPLALSRGKKNMDDVTESDERQTDADCLMEQASIYRAQMRDKKTWTPDCRDFYEIWSDWKQQNGYLDFTDLIETAITDLPVAPGEPSVMIGDECQDWSKLETHLFRDVWGKNCSTVVMAGDADQSIFEWRGADPRIFLDHKIPKQNHRVLDQSYRVPREIHALAQQWIRRISVREDVIYMPVEEQGEVIRADFCSRTPQNLVATVERRFEEGESCMILASCSYMLTGIIKCLKNRGLPFGNLYRKSNASWNPLLQRKKAVMPVNRVDAFLAPDTYGEPWRERDNKSAPRWTHDELKAWVSVLDTKILQKGIKKEIVEEYFKMPETFGEFAARFFKDPERDAEPAIRFDLEWFKSNIMKAKAGPIEYVADTAARFGARRLFSPPLITVGTIHSVKGGEADNVFLLPDLSNVAMREYVNQHSELYDAIIRVFYVGMTRARKRLYIGNQSSRNSVDI